MLKVMLFHDFVEDNRLSMEVYADGLSQALRTHFIERCQLEEFRPRIMPWLHLATGTAILQMRLSRYLAYPWQVRRQQTEINHIVDHGYGHLLYFLNAARTIVTVHDLIPLVKWIGEIPNIIPGRKPWLNLFSFKALRRAAHLIAGSENTKRDLIRLLGVRSEKITVVYYGVDSVFRHYKPEERDVARRLLNLPADGTHRLLVIGSQFYKNLDASLRAIARLCKQYTNRLQLIKTDLPTTEWTRTVQELGLNESVRYIGIVPRAQLPALYNSVECLVFPSLYEGFGLPPLEAMACGTPVIASNMASLPEVIGDAGLMVDPLDEDGLARAIHTVLTNDELRYSLIERGLVRAEQFTWEKVAQKTFAVYEKVARCKSK